MKYVVSAADRAPAPANYRTEARYLGYDETDRQQPYAKYFTDVVADVQPQAMQAIVAGQQPSEFGY